MSLAVNLLFTKADSRSVLESVLALGSSAFLSQRSIFECGALSNTDDITRLDERSADSVSFAAKCIDVSSVDKSEIISDHIR